MASPPREGVRDAAFRRLRRGPRNGPGAPGLAATRDEEIIMPRTSVSLTVMAGVAAAFTAQPTAARAAQEQSFEARTTAQLVDLCATPPSDPAYPQAVQFCHGFAVGALSYHRAASRPGSNPNFCGLPTSRKEAVDRFVAWTRANPRVADDNPANALFRFLDANYACRR